MEVGGDDPPKRKETKELHVCSMENLVWLSPGQYQYMRESSGRATRGCLGRRGDW